VPICLVLSGAVGLRDRVDAYLLSPSTARSRRTIRRVCSTFALPIAVWLPLLARALRPWFRIRFGSMLSTRIGHFAANVELELLEQRRLGEADPRPLLALSCFRNPFEHGPPANRQLAKLWRRSQHVLPAWLLGPAIRLEKVIGGANSPYLLYENTDRDVNLLLEKYPPSVAMTEEEIERGWQVLSEVGIPVGTPFVAVCARDSGYLRHRNPDRDYAMHDYRNVDIRTFGLAAVSLERAGYAVVRVGREVEEPWDPAIDRFFDYSTSRYAGDFMDIFLTSQCAFMISTQCGIDSVAHVLFRRPTLMVGVVPMGLVASSRSDCMAIFKHHVDIESGAVLDVDEIGRRRLLEGVRTETYAAAGVRLVENSKEEIARATEEMIGMLSGSFTPDPALQEAFRARLRVAMGDRFDAVHGDLRVRIGDEYLQSSGILGGDWAK